MHEIKEKAKKICELKDRIFTYTDQAITNDCVDVDQAGQLVDMIKDLCDAEKNIYKAAYYCSIVEAMKEEEQMEELEAKMGMDNSRMGYDHWRTSSGRYANKGTGHWTPIHGGRRGYTPAYLPPEMMDEERKEMEWMAPYMMGYDNRGGGNRSQGSPNSTVGAGRAEYGSGRMGYSDPDMERYINDDRHGRSFRNWQLARKHYTETKSDGDRAEMTEHAKEHMVDTCMTLKDIWQDATPELRERMKKDLTALMAEMK